MRGTLHPITQYLRRAIAVFKEMGFSVLDSPEVVTEQHNFDDLRIPKDHPARRMQDTFWLTDGRLPRTHTSAHQIPAMKDQKPPVRFVVPGRAFRNEATDATHETMFLNFEALAIDKTGQITLAHLKGTLHHFLSSMYGPNVGLKFVPSYFPFTEPSLEIYAQVRGRWIEMGGAGMVHPGVIKNMGLDPQKYQGFAFGVGIDRLVMLQHGIDDVRYFYSGNLRFLKQFVDPEPIQRGGKP